MDKVKEFCDEARKRNIKFVSLAGCIDSIESGMAMNKKEKEACEFLGEPNTFWNPSERLDYNFFRDHREEIEAELSE